MPFLRHSSVTSTSFFAVGEGVPDEECLRCIAVIAINDECHINIDDVTFLEYLLSIWDAVTNYLIDAGADGLGKSHGSQEERFLLHELVSSAQLRH